MANPIQKPALLVILLVLIVGSVWYLESMKAAPLNQGPSVSEDGQQAALPASDQPVADTTPITDGEQTPLEGFEQSTPAIDKSGFKKAPEFAGIERWINTEPLTLEQLRGKVVLVDFWTYTCINCIRTLPYLKEWDEKYRDLGLVIVGVHTPEFAFEKKYENVVMAKDKYGLMFPIAQDNNYQTWAAYKNRYWPHKYLIDTEGYIRYDHIGEGNYPETEEMIKTLLAERGMNVAKIEATKLPDNTPTQKISPEMYAGYAYALPRGQNIGNPEGLQQDTTILYKMPQSLKENVIYLEGSWKSNPDDLMLVEGGGQIFLKYQASSVNTVADAKEPVKVEVFINGNRITKEQAGSDIIFKDNKAYLMIDKPRLYAIYQGDYGSNTLTLAVQGANFSFNAFTFG
ncbi:thioredoxin family protein [Candidatus Woesearchaeota archaeon]|nr:thioredoxin family protein [Candidatus Woesearchaeota archaeon]